MTPGDVTELAGAACLALLVPAIALVVLRLMSGPTDVDRAVAIDVLSFLGVGTVAAIALGAGVYVLLDATAVPALVGFVATAAFASALDRRTGGDA